LNIGNLKSINNLITPQTKLTKNQHWAR